MKRVVFWGALSALFGSQYMDDLVNQLELSNAMVNQQREELQVSVTSPLSPHSLGRSEALVCVHPQVLRAMMHMGDNGHDDAADRLHPPGRPMTVAGGARPAAPSGFPGSKPTTVPNSTAPGPVGVEADPFPPRPGGGLDDDREWD